VPRLCFYFAGFLFDDARKVLIFSGRINHGGKFGWPMGHALLIRRVVGVDTAFMPDQVMAEGFPDV